MASQAVKILVRRRIQPLSSAHSRDLESSRSTFDELRTPSTPALAHLSAPTPVGSRDRSIPIPTLHHADADADAEIETGSSGQTPTSSAPDTPTLQPTLSLSSSIASLDPLNRPSVPNSPAMHAVVERLGMTGISERLVSGQAGQVGQPGQTGLAAKEQQSDEWEEVEIGKGLALYNSTEMDRLKGQKR